MEMINKLTKDSILGEEVFDEIFSQEDEIYKARLTLTLLDRAKELGVKKKFEDLLKAYTKVQKQMIEKEKNNRTLSMLDQWTNFSDCEYDRMKCLNWIADVLYIARYGRMSAEEQIFIAFLCGSAHQQPA